MQVEEITVERELASLRKIAEGREAEVYALDDGRVLRLLRGGSRARLEAELAAMQAGGELPYVPRAYGIATVAGRHGLVMERLDGDDLLTRLGRQPWRMWQTGRITGEVQARLHEVVLPPDVPSVHERAGSNIDRAAPEDVRAQLRSLLSRLPDGDRACHLDFHPGNIMITRRGPVVIDWPNARRGHPAADVARTLLILDLGELPDGSSPVLRLLERFGRREVRGAYVRAYSRAAGVPAGLRQWRVVIAADRLADGIPHERTKLLAIIERALAGTDETPA